jgi:hypothetical protein
MVWIDERDPSDSEAHELFGDGRPGTTTPYYTYSKIVEGFLNGPSESSHVPIKDGRQGWEVGIECSNKA